MPRKLTNEEFVAKLQDIQPNIIPLESYVNAYTTIKCMCIKHNELCYSTPKRLLRGHCCCKKCISEHKRDRLLLTHDEFLQKLREKNIDVVPLEQYKGNTTKILFRCSCGDLWETTPERVLLGNHCKKCGYHGRLEMPNIDGKIIWRCPACGCIDQDLLHATVRVCGYIASNTFNQGRMQEIEERVTHF